MPFLLPIFMFLAGLFGAGHIVSTVATAEEQVAFRVAQEQTTHEAQPPVQNQCGQAPEGCQFGYLVAENGCPIGCAPPFEGGEQKEFSPGPMPGDQEQGQWDQGQGNEQCMKDATRALSDMERFQFKDMERELKDIARNKVAIPQELRDEIAQARTLITDAKNLTDCQEMWSKQNEANSILNDAREKMNELRRAGDDARCVKDMQRSFKDMERHMVGDLERRVKQIARQKVQIPQDVTDALARMKELFAQGKQATTCEGAQEFMQQIQELQGSSQEFFMRLEFLSQAPKMIKQINRELKNQERRWNSAKRRVKSSKADLADLVGRGDAIMGELKGMFEEFKQVVASGDFERMQAMEERGQEAEEKMDELNQLVNTVQALSNAPRHLKGLASRANDLRRMARNLERREAGSGDEILSCLENYQQTYDALKEAVAQRPVDHDEVAGAIEASEDAIGECFDAAGELSGEKGFFEGVFGGFGGPQGGGGPGGPSPQPPKGGF